MFGSSKIHALEDQLRELNSKLERVTKEKDDLQQALDSARQQAAALEERLHDTDFEQMKEEVRTARAEFEGLKELYARKLQAFEDSKLDREQEFARQAALERYNLDNEIRESRLASQEFIGSTVRTFSESYNYYLNQIKLLMDALGDVAARTGEALFVEDNEDLKAKIGQQMADKLKAETDPLRADNANNGDLILIGTVEEEAKPEPAEPVDEAEEPAAEEAPEAEEDQEPVEEGEPAEEEEPADEEEPEA